MKKIYNAPEITVIEQVIEPVMYEFSIINGGNGDGSDVESKGAIFEEDDDFDDWNGWN